MESRKHSKKQPYSKPKITRITLKTKESILGFCKTTLTISQPQIPGLGPCTILNCLANNGS
jgi:hypothetical protein